jgi:hypothetical protein
MLSVFPRPSGSIALTSESSGFVLFAQPLEELLKPGIGQNNFDSVERIAEFIVTPGFVDEILAAVARRYDFSSTFAARHNVVPSRGHLPLAKSANLVHTVYTTFLKKHIHSCCVQQHSFKSSNPWLVSSTSLNSALSKSRKKRKG